jgi:LmbE family N-acetylglucosaminyl deacetylase
MNKVLRYGAVAAGVGGIGLYALYRWQPQRFALRLKPVPDEIEPVDPDADRMFSSGASVAVVVAHPDDAEFYVGGTLARLNQHGARIGLIVTTDGDKGYYPRQNADRNRTVRRDEQIRSARRFGCDNVTFLGHPDGRLKATLTLARQIRDAVRSFDADYVLTFDPVYHPRLQHSDHLVTGQAAICAVKDLRGVQWVMAFSTRAPNFAVDITEVWAQKLHMLAAHESQFHGRKLRMIERFVHDTADSYGQMSGVPLAEGFRVVHTHSSHRV